MNNNTKHNDSFYFWALIFRNKWFVILFTIIATGISTGVAFYLPVWYKSTINVVPPKNPADGDGMGSGISSALKDFGLTKLGGAKGESYSFTVILNSRTVIDSLIRIYNLHTVYNLPQTSMTKIRDEFFSNIEITIEKEGNYTISVWDTDAIRASRIANDYINIANNHAVKVFKEEASVNVNYLENRIATLDNQLKLISNELSKFSNKNLLFAPEEQARAVSTAMVDLKSNEIQYEMMLNVTKIRYGENDPQSMTYKKLLEEVRAKIKQVETEPGFAGNFPLNKTSDVSLEYMRLFSQYEVFTKLKAILLPSLEKAKLDVVRSATNLFVVDPAEPADQKDKPRRSLIIGGTFAVSLIFSMFLVVFTNNLMNFKRKYKVFKNDFEANKIISKKSSNSELLED
ncbi:MAG: GumC family protein [Candidatus Kapaibacteriota bacterium]|jgi:capsule polysaccharide export protein KpsE/RkpR